MDPPQIPYDTNTYTKTSLLLNWYAVYLAYDAQLFSILDRLNHVY